ncbi:hypothetical protein ACET3Z_031246 [Daucus carota]
MSSERRRSARLIESPWVYNRPKREPVYVDLDEDGGGSFEGLHNPVRKLQKLQVQNPSAGGTKSGSDIAVNHGNLELRSEWEMGNGSQVAQDSEEEDDFVTPAEHFEKTKPISKHTILRKKFNVKSAEIETEKQGKTTGKRIRETEQPKILKLDAANIERGRRQALKKGIVEKGKKSVAADGGNLAVLRYENKVSETGRENSPGRDEKIKKVRSYEGYLQRKISPGIMTHIFKNLSEEQVKWVRSTGFGGLLSFDMEHYVHELGYNIVESFDRESCALFLKCGVIGINDIVVNNVLGLPMGGMLLKKNRMDLILPFGENNSKKHLPVTDVFDLELNLDSCDRYNWCRLLIDKLRTSHAYWAEEKKRSFAGSLPFLIFLYLSKVRNSNYAHVPAAFPSHIGWTDKLIREREKNEVVDGSFGVGEIVELVVGNEDKGVEIMIQNAMVNTYTATDEAGRRASSPIDEMEENPVLQREGNTISDHMQNAAEQCLKEYNDDVPPIMVKSAKQNKEETSKGCMKPATGGKSELNHTASPLLTAEQCLGSMFEKPDVQGTQGTKEDFIDNHFREDKYMAEFSRNLEEFGNAYEKCLNNFEVAFALYPNNEELAKLREKHRHFFKLLEDNSPLSKKLLSLRTR